MWNLSHPSNYQPTKKLAADFCNHQTSAAHVPSPLLQANPSSTTTLDTAKTIDLNTYASQTYTYHYPYQPTATALRLLLQSLTNKFPKKNHPKSMRKLVRLMIGWKSDGILPKLTVSFWKLALFFIHRFRKPP